MSDNQNNSNNEINDSISEKTYLAAVERSKRIEADIAVNPKKYRVLTGDRPTGRLHIGHYFGSLQNRVKLSKQGVPTCILIADYQVLTDHDAFSEISQNTKQLVIDYLAAGILTVPFYQWPEGPSSLIELDVSLWIWAIRSQMK